MTTTKPDAGSLPIGTTVGADEPAPARLRAARFNRHTFWCGQSGSGKTYALGVVLEQLLLHTDLQLVVLDPNADFVRLDQVREDAEPEFAAQLLSRDIRVLRSGPSPEPRLHVRFTDLEPRTKAAVLQLDPVVDLEEYNVLLHLQHEFGRDHAGFMERLTGSADPGHVRLRRRIENLGVLHWDVWAWEQRSAQAVLDDGPAATVLDLGHFASRAEGAVAALSVLDHLWASRDRRRPMLIVIDEAHNLCSPNPVEPLDRALTDRIVQIAAEGRKYGLWLLLSTQQPGKVHQNVLSQCDNLCLMKMSASRDLAELAAVFGFAPEELLARSPRFQQGQALFAGGFTEAPTIAQLGTRLTPEGGSDVRVPLRTPSGQP